MNNTGLQPPLDVDTGISLEPPAGRVPQRLVRWVGVAGLITALPTPTLILLASIGIPLLFLITMDLRRLFAMAPPANLEGWTTTALVGSQLAILGALLYGAAACTSRVVTWLVAHKAIAALFASFAAVVVAADGLDLLIVRSLEAGPTESVWENLSAFLTR